MTTSPNNQPGHENDGAHDLFLSYNSRDREAVERVRQLLRDRAITTFFDRNDLTRGMPWQEELENAISHARAVAVFIGHEGIGAWQRPEKELALDRQRQETKAGRRFPVIPVVLPNAEIDKVTGFLSLNTWIDLRNRLDDPAELDALGRAVKGEPPAEQTVAAEPLCPYRGLEPFHEDDAPLFFGRDEFADGLLKKVLDHPLVAVVGPSGSGKSSVVQAGLLPRLRRECWPNETWEAIIFTPREHPFHSLAKELLPLYETAKSKTDQMIEARTLGEALAEAKIPLDDPIAATLAATKNVNRLLLVVDQLEELFTLSEERYRQPFIESLIAAASRADSPVTVVLTLRADFYGQAIGLSRSLSDSIQQGLVNLGPMTRDELRQAIEEPARRVGLSFEPGLVARLLDDVKGQPGNLPLLEFALKELWQRRQGGTITNEQYDAIGTLEGAISKRADAQLERVAPAEREAVLRAFTRLVRVSAANEEGTDTRQRVRLKDLAAAVQPIMKSFAKERLLVMSRDEATNEEIVEVAHEALIRRWERLKEWLNKDREFLLWRQRLRLMLSDWQRTDGDEGTLLRGSLLEEAKRWLQEEGQNLTRAEKDFITWEERDEYQIKQILLRAVDLSRTSEEWARKKWIFTACMCGEADEAFRAVPVIEEAKELVTALSVIIKALVKTGKSSEAQKTIDEALPTFWKLNRSYNRIQALGDFLPALVETRRVVEARQAIATLLQDLNHEKIPSVSNLIQELASIAKTLVKSFNNSDELQPGASSAYSVLQKLIIQNGNIRFLRDLSAALIGVNREEEAFHLAREIPDAFSRALILSDIANTLVKLGKVKKALQAVNEATRFARDTTDSYRRAEALGQLAQAMVRVGNEDQAMQVAEESFRIIQESEIRSTRDLTFVEWFRHWLRQAILV